MKTQKKTTTPHIGKLLDTYYKKNRVNKAGLARVLNRNRSSVQNYEQSKSLQCSVLWNISLALQHNFFADLAAQLPSTFTTNAPDPTLALQEELEQLREENNILEGKLETLKEVMRKG